jgi:hypothetical protein
LKDGQSCAYVTHRWLAATAVSVLGIALALSTVILGLHAENPHKGAVRGSEMATRDKLQDERHKEVMKRLDTIEGILRKR